ncbi:MAG: ferrochelatase [Candidatus Competibacterales bacterium]
MLDRTPNTTFHHDQIPCTGILVANLGTPDTPTYGGLRRYLRQFLSDPRLDIKVFGSRALWWPILYGIVLTFRPRSKAKEYGEIWTDEGSPLLVTGRRQVAALQRRLDERCPGKVAVALGMRYGNPSIAAALGELRAAGAERVLLLPLYPQYAAATTASTFDALAQELAHWRWLPEVRMVNHYHDYPPYIDALVGRIRAAWEEKPPLERLLFSFHGVPGSALTAGDPYHCQCHKTARLVAEALGLDRERWAVAFQSRFGDEVWLKPYTDELLKEWAGQGVKSVDVICPGFSTDCLETIAEIDEENREYFLEAGGQDYRYIAALNEGDDHMDFLAELILQHTRGWPEMDAAIGAPRVQDEAARQKTLELALALGAAQ